MILSIVACGPGATMTAALGEVCGHDGPFRVLELDPGHGLAYSPAVLRFKERIYLQIDNSLPSGKPEVWSFGPCGESPLRLDPTITSVFVEDRWPDILLGTNQAGDILTVDLEGGPPHVLFAGPDTAVGAAQPWTDHGYVSFDLIHPGLRSWYIAAVRVHPYPADPRTETVPGIVLYEPVRVDTAFDQKTIADIYFQLFDDELLVVTDDQMLVHVALTDGAVTVEQEGVSEAWGSLDGRYIFWREKQSLSQPTSSGKIYRRDTSDGSDKFLTIGSLGGIQNSFVPVDARLFTLMLDPYLPRQRVYFVDTLDHIDLPAGRRLAGTIEDGRWLFSAHGNGDPPIELFDPKDGSVTTLVAADESALVRVQSHGIEVLEHPRLTALHYPVPVAQGRLYLQPYDGSPRRLLAEAASDGYRALGDGRYVSNLDIGDDSLGRLVLLDPDLKNETPIDDRVALSFAGPSEAFGDDVLTYVVSDGDRSGVWLARIEPK